MPAERSRQSTSRGRTAGEAAESSEAGVATSGAAGTAGALGARSRVRTTWSDWGRAPVTVSAPAAATAAMLAARRTGSSRRRRVGPSPVSATGAGADPAVAARGPARGPAIRRRCLPAGDAALDEQLTLGCDEQVGNPGHPGGRWGRGDDGGLALGATTLRPAHLLELAATLRAGRHLLRVCLHVTECGDGRGHGPSERPSRQPFGRCTTDRFARALAVVARLARGPEEQGRGCGCAAMRLPRRARGTLTGPMTHPEARACR